MATVTVKLPSGEERVYDTKEKDTVDSLKVVLCADADFQESNVDLVFESVVVSGSTPLASLPLSEGSVFTVAERLQKLIVPDDWSSMALR